MLTPLVVVLVKLERLSALRSELLLELETLLLESLDRLLRSQRKTVVGERGKETETCIDSLIHSFIYLSIHSLIHSIAAHMLESLYGLHSGLRLVICVDHRRRKAPEKTHPGEERSRVEPSRAVLGVFGSGQDMASITTIQTIRHSTG